jgi:hypothetical protein
MLRPFSFINTEPTSVEGRNWRTFDEASKTLVKTDLVVTNASGSVTCPNAYFTLYGPIVFYDLSLAVANGDGWTVSTYITMPYEPLFNATASRFAAGHVGSAFIDTAKAFLSFAYFSDVANIRRLSFGSGYTNSTGATSYPSVQGWYYRN